jgi:hypothetical protein
MKQFATLKDLFGSICSNAVDGISQSSSGKLQAISQDIISGWLGEPQDKTLLGPLTEHSELVWRIFYLQQSVYEIRSVLAWADALPSNRVKISKSEQLKFIWWVYLSRVNEFQDRLFKFHQAARLQADDASKDKFVIKKDAFTKQFLTPIKSLIDLRNHWVHDREPDFVGLKRLSSLELFITAYSIEPNSVALANLLKNQARSVAAAEKKRLTLVLKQNEMAFEKLADFVVCYASQHANLNLPSTR